MLAGFAAVSTVYVAVKGQANRHESGAGKAGARLVVSAATITAVQSAAPPLLSRAVKVRFLHVQLQLLACGFSKTLFSRT